MRRTGWFFWNLFEKRPQPADAEDESVAAIVRLLKSRHVSAEEEKEEESPSRIDQARNRRRR